MSELPPLPDSLIMLVEVGSTCHGTGLPGGEDLDLLGVLIESPTQVVGLDEQGYKNTMQRTQEGNNPSQPGDIDRQMYSLRNFCRLAAKGNPSVLQALWAPIYDYTIGEFGYQLRELGPSFIGKHMIPKYMGYMQAQALRLLGLRGGDHGKRRENLINAHGYDTKFAMHAARLGFQCIELIETQHLNLPMQGDEREWLLSVRKGEVEFEEWWKIVLALDSALQRSLERSILRDGPDVQTIESFMMRTHLKYWEKSHGV